MMTSRSAWQGHLYRVALGTWAPVREAFGRVLYGAAAALFVVSLGTPFQPAVAQALPQPQLRLEPGTHWAAVRRIAVNADQSWVATASDDKTVRIWSAAERTLLQTLRPPLGEGTAGRLYGVAFHPRLPMVALAGTSANADRGQIYLFHPATGELLRTVDTGRGEIKRLVWDREGRWLAAAFAAPGAVRVFSVEGQETGFAAFTGDVYGLDISAKGVLAATDVTGSLRLFRLSAEGGLNLLSQTPTPAPEPIAVAFSPDGSRLALVHFSRGRNGVVDVLSPENASVMATLRPGNLISGRSQSVAWNDTGTVVSVGGSRSDPTAVVREAIDSVRGFIQRYDLGSGRELAPWVASTDTITDLATLTGNRYAYASFDGSWGIAGSEGAITGAQAGSSYVRRADRLLISADANAVQWQSNAGTGPQHFVLRERVVRPGAMSSPILPPLPSVFSGTRDWESPPSGQPTLLGTALPLAAGEISRAVSLVGKTGDLAWGTGQRLLRVGPSGAIRWSIQPGAETRAVHASSDGRLIVAALSDGTLRWYRAADGVLLLSLFAPSPQRWVIWTPQGFYDASPGAEYLIGWHLNGASGRASEFFSIGRFRERFHRPDVIDLVLNLADESKAVAAADTLRAEALATAQRAETAPAAPTAPNLNTAPTPAAHTPSAAPNVALSAPSVSALAAAPLLNQLPPTLLYKQSRDIEISTDTVTLDFGVVLRGDERVTGLVVRRDGILQETREERLPSTFDGRSAGAVRIEVPVGVSTVHVVAHNAHGFSDALAFQVRRKPPPAPAPPVAPKPPDRSSPAATPNTRLFVLAVGVAAYLDPRINRLEFAAKDANDFSALLQAQGGRAYSSVETRVLTNQTATKSAIAAGLKWLSTAVGKNDMGILFLAGHAVNHPSGSYYYFAHDTVADRIASTAVDERAIRSALVGLRGRAVLFVDTCHAGNAVGRALGFSRDTSRIAADLASPENGVIVFASSTGRQDSLESREWGNGAFTKAVLTGLRGAADFTRRGRITFQGLGYFVSGEVARLTDGEQTPVLIAPPPGAPDFTLALLSEKLSQRSLPRAQSPLALGHPGLLLSGPSRVAQFGPLRLH
jgi:WD40 repeat protein